MWVPGAKAIRPLIRRTAKALSRATATLSGRRRREAIRRRLRRRPEGWSDERPRDVGRQSQDDDRAGE